MSDRDDEEILVVVASEAPPAGGPIERGFIDRGTIENIRAVSVSALQQNMEAVFKQLRQIVGSAQEAIGAFQLEQIEVMAQVTGEGKVCLLGTGAKMELQGGIKFILKKNPA